ncbi:MAG: hypothetical protein OEU32_04020 [Acidimicrobiia bacterium]|nr:hypothetical protein [Acidimicrobiia bacterium]
MVVSREWYVAVQDRRYELELALDDVRRWRRGDRSERSVEETLAWLESHVEALLDIGRS